MNLKLYKTTLSALVCAFASTLLFAAESGNTDYTNGKISTVNEKSAWAAAVAIKDGKFVKAGSNSDTALVTVAPAATQTQTAANTTTTTDTITTPTTGGSCVAYDRTYANGSTTWCSLTPGPGHVCPLGLHFSQWTCSNGQWIRSQ